MLKAPNLAQFPWLAHGFGLRDSQYPAGISSLQQIHSGIVVEAAPPGGDRFASGDALITGEAGMPVGVRTADCVPILIADGRIRAVAAIHAGWRGTAERIVAKAAQAMVDRYGSRPEDLHAAIGPAIGACCYEVGPEVARRFEIVSDLPVKIDLASQNEMQLKELGLRDVWQSRECTFCGADRYFSFRREKEGAGRMISYIGVV